MFVGVTTSTCVLHVPSGKVDEYRATSPWSKFSNIVDDIVDDIKDVNADGMVDVGDVNVVLGDILAGGTNAAFDVNGDGNVDVGDVNTILQEILAK